MSYFSDLEEGCPCSIIIIGEERIMGKERKIHHNNMDIVQRLMAETMKGFEPLKVFNYRSKKVKEVLSTDMPKVETVDDKADTLYLLEDGDFLHVEYQTTVKKDDIFRFASYSLRLYNKVREKSEKKNPNLQTVVIYSPSVREEDIIPSLDIGSLKFKSFPIHLKNELKRQAEFNEIVNKMRGNPNISLSKEEQMRLIYQPLFNSERKEIEMDAYYIIRSLQELADDSLKAHLSGMIYVLVRRFLSEEGDRKIWEELIKMSTVEKELKKIFGFDAGFDEGKQEMKESIFKELVSAIKEGESDRFIQRLIRLGDFTEQEVHEAFKKARER
ncbi:hypothetical protein P5G51_019625 [Virgibacillus sp. 179-BFC.A HS]|uniref:Transposase (putative) YhgA-like domain-containing protein n=1 Tax=Tigheibacillus jepli TaxID=3035914 RepID=A0ABU5CLL8_9BACI|nr:hypothetical protein [Virgibacillus sp. 179-BFC.A HS]MDY0407244.1 hypothetical protein [Virgibacillus sp. 179-BFC.A HS]